jgi:cell division protein FtsZ
MDAFRSADEVLLSGVQGITNLITTPGLINLDFADVKSVMSGRGQRADGHRVLARGGPGHPGRRQGDQLAAAGGVHGRRAGRAAVHRGGSDLGLFEINEAASLVQEAAHPEANIIFGTVIDDSLGDEVRVTVIAAGFDAGGPTHKKLEPEAFGRGARGPGAIAPGVSGTTGQAPPAPAVEASAPPAVHGNGNGSVPPPNGSHQAGVLPPGAGTGGFTPPAPRVPDSLRVEAPRETPRAEPLRPESLRAEPLRPESLRPESLPAPPEPVVERSRPAHTVQAADFDDDVDVPPFMKR